ncbi:hypothetical protein [Vibrio anguillarum]|uniref:hypothetical protein n=1 Tax=Vibrio anguillarum TaxID=55601 RepID=UPI00188A0F4D|nr:hypothetical protein [Vibrio anguillarum]
MDTKQRKVQSPFAPNEMLSAFRTLEEARAKRDFSKFNKPVGERLVKSIQLND